MNQIHRSWRFFALALAGLAGLAGCGSGSYDGSAAPAYGTMRLSMTDSPACGYDNVFVTVEKVRVHQSATAGDGDAGWSEVVVAAPHRIDLLGLTNGVLETLGQTALPAGTYQQLRLVLAQNAGAPMANALKLAGAVGEIALTTPSGQQSGLKMNVNLTVAPNQVADFVLDFDACKSIVKAGNSGQYQLKPVLSVIARIGDAGQRVVGYIDTATLALGGSTTVSAQLNGSVVKSTPPDATGLFVLYPVPAGTYDLVVVSTDRASAVMTGVPVTTTEYTRVGSATARIGLVASTSNDATGAVSLNGSTTNTGATVRATQTLYLGPTIEVANRPADADTGAYAYSLPIGAPRKTAYAPALASIGFVVDSTDPTLTAAGKYRLEAAIPGLVPMGADISLLAGDVATPFAFVAP